MDRLRHLCVHPARSSIDSLQGFHYTRRMRPKVLLLICLLLVTPALAQQRPLVTERAETADHGTVLFDLGVEFLQGAKFPFSGLEGDLTRAGVFSTRMGVGERVEVQISGAAHQFLNIDRRVDAPGSGELDFSGDSTSDFGNISLATKIRLTNVTHGKPILGLRFGVELPNSSNEKGMGTDETNVFAQLLLQHKLERVDLLGNIGIAILGDPVDAGAQDDLLTYGLGVILQATPRLNVVAEINGRTGPSGIGTEDQAHARAGIQFEAGGLYWDVAGFVGLQDTDPDSGIIVGLSRSFRAWGR